MSKRNMRRIGIIICWLCVWQLVSLVCDNAILMVGPWETLRAFFRNLAEPQFWKTVLVSCGRICAGLLLGILPGALLAAGSYRFRFLEECLKPFVTLIKAIPVASFAVILLIWWGSGCLSVVVSMLVVFPHIYANVLEGLRNTDKKLLEMAGVFNMPLWNKAFYIYRPAVRPFWNSAIGVSVGMAWKSGVAAEVIGLPAFSVGEHLYLSKIHLETAEVFAWTAVTILLSTLTEKGIKWLSHLFFEWKPACFHPRLKERVSVTVAGDSMSAPQILVQDVYQSYGGTEVIKDWSAVYESGQVYYFRSPSGSGKTTMFRLISGLEQPQQGSVRSCRISMMFQEDRLCEEYSAVKNVELVTGDAQAARKQLAVLLPEEALDKPCSCLSGGMKRRVALVRALQAESEFCLLDEPFTGLDPQNRNLAAGYIEKEMGQRGVLIATHDR